MAIEYGDWPKTSGPPVSKVEEHSQKLVAALCNEVEILDGKPRGKERPLTRLNKKGRIACCLLVSAKKMPVDEVGHLAAHAGTVDEAKEWIKEQIEKIQAGELREKIGKHLAAIQRRRRRGPEGGGVS